MWASLNNTTKAPMTSDDSVICTIPRLAGNMDFLNQAHASHGNPRNVFVLPVLNVCSVEFLRESQEIDHMRSLDVYNVCVYYWSPLPKQDGAQLCVHRWEHLVGTVSSATHMTFWEGRLEFPRHRAL